MFFGIRLISIYFDFTGRFNQLPIFSDNFDSIWTKSLGDLLINIILLLWMMIFFHKDFPLRTFSHLDKKVRFGLTIVNYFSVILGILLLTGVFKTIVFNASVSFDFDNVFNLNKYSLFSIIGVICLLVALFIFSHRMMTAISKMELSHNERLGALTLASILALPILWVSEFLLPWFFISLLAFIIILIFDLFIDSRHINFTWLVIWMVVLAAFPAFLLYKYNTYKDRVIRLSYAKELAELRDEIAENSFSEMKAFINVDPTIRENLAKPYPFRIDEEEIKKHIDHYFTRDNYLFYNYKYSLFAFDKYNEPAILNQTEHFSDFNHKLLTAMPTKIDGLNFWLDKEEKSWSYLMNLDIPVRNNQDNPLNIILEFERTRREHSKVYTELLEDKPYRNLASLGKYDYAVYINGNCYDSEGKVYNPVLSLQQTPQPGKSVELKNENRSELVYASSDNNTIVVVGREKETFIQAISLFSYIFGLLILFVFFFALYNTFFHILPGILDFSQFQKPSLKTRIQLSVIVLTIFSFINNRFCNRMVF